MSLFDRLRGQPKWQDEDPSVRVSAVDDLEDEAQDLFVMIALKDEDPGVRAAAVARLSDPETLARIVRSDSAAGVRDEAVAMLRRMAVDGTDSEVAITALAGLFESRDLGEVARAATLESVSSLALERLDSQKIISLVARRSIHEVVRRAALARLDNQDELLTVTIKSDHKDMALRAFERLAFVSEDRELLETIITRARTKTVARRARAQLTALDARPTPPSIDEIGKIRERLREDVEGLTSTTDLDLASDRLARAEREWRSLGDPSTTVVPTSLVTVAGGSDGDRGQDAATELDTSIDQRWNAARVQARAHLARLDVVRSKADHLERARSESVAARVALCEQLAALVIDDATGSEDRTVALTSVRDAWRILPNPTNVDDLAFKSEVQVLECRFKELVANAEALVQQDRLAANLVERLSGLVSRLEALSETGGMDDLKTAWPGLYREWVELAETCKASDVTELTTRVKSAEIRRNERLVAIREGRRRRELANLAKQQSRCDDLEQAVSDENLTLSDAERWLRTTRSLLENLGRLPARSDRDSLTDRLRRAHRALTGRLRELRDFVEWRQWANLSVQTGLCQRLEALATVNDGTVLEKELRTIMTAWGKVSDVSPGKGTEIWERFRSAHAVIRPRVEAYLSEQDARREEQLKIKLTLCEEVERLAESTEWVKTAQRLAELQQRWKEVGLVTRKQEREVWKRFRAACDRFFERRRDDLTQRKQIWAKNAKLREALCEKVEALVGESDLGLAEKTVKRLQAEWRSVGSVRRKRAETLWLRFRTASEQVYARTQRARDVEFVDKSSARVAACERLEALLSETGESGPELLDNFVEMVVTTKVEWRRLPSVPHLQGRDLEARFQAALAGVIERYPKAFSGSDLDPEHSRVALENLCERLEALLNGAAPPSAGAGSPAEILAANLREALAKRTMGAGVNPEAKRRADMDEVKRAQTERQALGMVPGEIGRQLSDRFQTAYNRFFQQYKGAPDERAPRPRGDGALPRPRPKRRPNFRRQG